MSNRLGGKQGTAYLGTNANQPPNWHFHDRAPNQYDTQNVSIGDLWLDQSEDEPWVLVSLAGDVNSKGMLANWIQFTGGQGSIVSLTANSGGKVFGDADANINVVGDASTINIVGNPATNTLTASTSGSIATLYTADSGTATPSLGNLNVLTTSHLSTSASGNTITISLDGDIAGEYVTDSGSAFPINGILNVLGTHNVTTSGALDDLTISGTNVITLGDLSNVAGDSITLTTGNITFSATNNVGNLNFPITHSSGNSGLIQWGGTYTRMHNFGAGTYSGQDCENIFIGLRSGNFTLTPTALNGVFNYMIGRDSGSSLTTGNRNVALGADNLSHCTTGTDNVAIGSETQNNITTGAENCSLGQNSLTGITTGNGNISIGDDCGNGYLSGTESYNVVIGWHETGINGESNVIRISSIATKCFIGGIRGITTGVNDAVAVLIDSSGQLGTTSSSIRFKENIQYMGDESSIIMKLRPVSFNYKETGYKGYGLIAEEVNEVMPYLVARDKEGEIYSVKYHELPAMLLNEIQKLNKRIEILESKI